MEWGHLGKWQCRRQVPSRDGVSCGLGLPEKGLQALQGCAVGWAPVLDPVLRRCEQAAVLVPLLPDPGVGVLLLSWHLRPGQLLPSDTPQPAASPGRAGKARGKGSDAFS